MHALRGADGMLDTGLAGSLRLSGANACTASHTASGHHACHLEEGSPTIAALAWPHTPLAEHEAILQWPRQHA